MQLTSFPQAYALNPHETTDLGDDIAHQVGMVGMDQYGDFYRFAKAGASAIAGGKLQLGPAPKTNHHNVAWASGGALGSNKVTVTLGATAAVANEYAGGILSVNDATGEGYHYRIMNHPAADSGATLEVTIQGALVEALVSGSEMTLTHNACNGVIESTTEELQVAGVAVVDIAATNFGWLKVRGVAPVLAQGAITLNHAAIPSASVAGAVARSAWAENATDATRFDAFRTVGRAVPVAGVDTEYRPIDLYIL